ncbi:MAG: F0F1 ATP synthase subunit C [Candidatus Hydrogenedentota bacterium]
MKRSLIAKIALMAMVVMVAMFAFAPVTFAQEHGEDGAEAADTDGDGGLGAGLIAIGAGLAVGLAGLGTGNAQAGVGAGGTGAIAEKPEVFTNVLILFAIPETIVILGFVVAFLLLNNI